RSPLMLPRNERRDSSDRRSNWARNSGVKKLARVAVGTALSLVEGLEVVLDLRMVVARHRLPRDRVLHHLAVLSDHPEVLQPRGGGAAAAGEVRVEAVLAPAARLALDADVVRRRAQPLGRLALGRAAAPLARQEPLTLAEVLILRPAAVTGAAVAAGAA